MVLEKRRIGFYGIKEGVFVRNRKDPSKVRVVICVAYGRAVWCDEFGLGMCSQHHLGNWGDKAAADSHGADLVMARVSSLGGMESLRVAALYCDAMQSFRRAP